MEGLRPLLFFMAILTVDDDLRVTPVVSLRYRFHLPLVSTVSLRSQGLQRIASLFEDVCTAWGVSLLSVSLVDEFVRLETSGSLPLQLPNFVGNLKSVSEHFVLGDLRDMADCCANQARVWREGFVVASLDPAEPESLMLTKLRAQLGIV